jgi:hypoxanthine phosphoribosyltransferase
MDGFIESILISEEEIDSITSSLAEKITEDYKNSDKTLVLLCLLKGSIIFMGDLMKKLPLPLEIEAMKVSSYGSSSVSSGKINIQLDLNRKDLSSVDILIVEDIIDSGVTLKYLKEMFATRGPLSIRVCTIFDKPSRRKVEMKGDYVGIEIPDEYVIGYGLDYDGVYRNLPDLCVLRRDVYEKE